MGTDNAGHKIFCLLEKKARLKTKDITTFFGMSLFIAQCRMRYAIYIPQNTRDLAINLTMVAYGNGQNGIMSARANSSDSLHALKHLKETRL